jgi:hypothetical protein
MRCRYLGAESPSLPSHQQYGQNVYVQYCNPPSPWTDVVDLCQTNFYEAWSFGILMLLIPVTWETIPSSPSLVYDNLDVHIS